MGEKITIKAQGDDYHFGGFTSKLFTVNNIHPKEAQNWLFFGK
jgi:hypothetical protein